MRLSLSLVIITVGATGWAVTPVARAQAAAASQPVGIQQSATQPAAAQPAAAQPAGAQAAARQAAGAQAATAQAAAPARERRAGHISRRSKSQHSPTGHAGAAVRGSAATGKGGGVLALGATDITGNKELPKVMVIVPWKDSLGAGGVVKPTDSLLDEALQPVDRGVFQRQVHYYGQLSAGEQRSAAGKVAPVGDSH